MQHGSAPASLVVWAAEAIPTPVPMQIARVTIDLMRPVPVAPLTLETEVLREGRKIQLCAVRLRAGDAVVVGATVLKIKTPGADAAAGGRGLAGRTARAGSIARRAGEFFLQPLRDGHVAARRARQFRRARSRRDLVSRRPAAGRGLAGLAGDARGGRGRFLQRHLGGAGFPRNGPSSMPTSPSAWRGSRSANGSCSTRNPGSVPMAPALRWRGSPISKAISAAPCRAW